MTSHHSRYLRNGIARKCHLNSPADFTNTPLVIPANYLLQINDTYGNEVAHRDVSRPYDMTASSFADKFADTSVYAYPLTAIFTLDPNAAAPVAPDTSC